MPRRRRRIPENPGAKLTRPEVREIRKLYLDVRDSARGTLRWTQTALAARFRVSQSTVSNVVRRRKWKESP